jgi:hypothetical protein
VKKTKNDLNKNRREFIKNSTLVGAGIAATAVIPGAVSASSEIEKPEDNKQKGYQLTAHILDYYKSAAS